MAKSSKIKASACGVDFVLDCSMLDDMDTMEALIALQDAAESEDEMAMLKAVTKLAYSIFGEKQYADIKKKLKKNGEEKSHILKCVEFTFKALEEAAKKKNGDLKN